MDQKHLPGYFLHLFRETESDNIRKAGERTGITVSIAHSSAGQNVISQEFPLFCNSHEAQVLSVYIHIIFRGKRKSDFKFARQISGTVQRLLLRARVDTFGIQPYFMIGMCLRFQFPGEFPGLIEDCLMDAGIFRVQRNHDIARGVSTGGNRGDGRVVDVLHGLFQILLDDSVDLNGLACRKFKGAVAELVA